MTGCIGSANGNGIFGSWTCRKSRRFRTRRSRIHVLNGWSAPSGANAWTGPCSGRPAIWRWSSSISNAITRSPHECRAGRTHARPERPASTRDSHFVSLAGALSWAASNTDRRMTGAPAGRRLPNLAVSPTFAGPFLRWVKPPWRRGLRGIAGTRVLFPPLSVAHLGIRHRHVSLDIDYARMSFLSMRCTNPRP